MTIIVNSGSTLTVPPTGLTLTADSTIAAGGTLFGTSNATITGDFNLVNDGIIKESQNNPGGGLIIGTAGFTNQGTVETLSTSLIVAPSVNLTNLAGGTLTGGEWEAVFGNLYFLNGTISQLNANLYMSGGTIFEVGPGGTGNQAITNTITEISNGSSVTNFIGDWSTQGPLNVDGYVSLIGTTLSATGGITISASGTVSAIGDILSPLTVNGSLIATSLELDGTLLGTGSITVEQGGLELASPGTINHAITLNAGYIEAGGMASGGTVTIAGNVSGSAETNFWQSNVDLGPTIGFAVGEGASLSSINALELDTATNFNVAFSQAFGTGGSTAAFGELILDQPGNFGGNVNDFDNDDTIVLRGIIGNTATWSGNVLTIMNDASTVYSVGMIPFYAQFTSGSHEEFEVVTESQNYGGANFVATPDSTDNETTITVSGIQDSASTIFPECFGAGTRISTPEGPVAVECIAPGDIVISHFGATRRVVWIGRREFDCRRHPDPRSVWPVLISPNAFAPGRPHSELFLSPEHAVFVDGVLIPVRLLINGTTIRSIETSCVTWYHVELDQHDVVFAEGLAVESYLDQRDRGFFANRGAPAGLFPNFTARMWEMAGCAPLVMSGIRLARTRVMLQKRASDGMLLHRATHPSADAA
jgi:hypothetical protein